MTTLLCNAPGGRATWPEVATAIGTLSAVVLALGLALWPNRPWIKPRLKVRTGVGEPFLRPVSHEGSFSVDELRVRVGIENTGRRTASHVGATLSAWWEYDPNDQLGFEWNELDADPLPLKWVSLRPGDDRPFTPSEVSIPPGRIEFLDLLLWRSDSMTILFDDNRQALFRRRRSPGIGRWRVEFSISGSNVRAFTKVVEVHSTVNQFVSAVELAERPESSLHVGLFNLLGLAATKDDGMPNEHPNE